MKKYQWHSLNFSQPFFKISQETFLYKIYRFMVFKYEPTRLTPSNVNYYFISDHKMGEYGEFAILGVCDYREKGIMKQEAKLVINRGDRETFHYIKILLLERIEQERKKERSAERRLMVELKGNIW